MKAPVCAENTTNTTNANTTQHNANTTNANNNQTTDERKKLSLAAVRNNRQRAHVSVSTAAGAVSAAGAGAGASAAGALGGADAKQQHHHHHLDSGVVALRLAPRNERSTGTPFASMVDMFLKSLPSECGARDVARRRDAARAAVVPRRKAYADHGAAFGKRCGASSTTMHAHSGLLARFRGVRTRRRVASRP